MSNCRDCKESINKGASKCHHCGAHQNWQRYLNTSTLMAGFILSGISIWVAPPVKEMFEAKKADIRISILDSDHLNMTFMISNVGNQPAGLSQIEIESKLKHGPAFWFLPSDLDNKLIEPGKAYIVKASNGSLVPAAVSHEVRAVLAQKKIQMKDNCNLVVQYVQMNGTKEYMHYPFLCNAIDPTEKSELKLK